MLKEIFNFFRQSKAVQPRYIPSSTKLPELWPEDNSGPRLEILKSADTQTLTELCDEYWNSFFEANDEEAVVRDSQVHRCALEIIESRAREALPWMRERLTHPGYDAREDAASLIMQLAEQDLLGDEKQEIARELMTLAVTPPVDDTKEAQAASVALSALSVIGGDDCIATVRHVLTSEAWDYDDNQWECAEILAGLTNEPFMDSDDPVASAKQWLETHPG